jgi:MoaA/NifB/PqqE/SkfB family radical SAM enzyme
MKTYDFANILLSGQCNLRCPHCIGHASALQSMPNNLKTFPLKGLEKFVDELNCHGVIQVSLTGTNTDPQLYAYEPELIDYLRKRIAGVKISLHTNGKLAMQKMEVFNLYDRATLSLPSFESETYRRMTGSPHVLDLAGIVQISRIPLKVSTVITEHNINEIPSIMARCRELGISRMVLRKLYGETRRWNLFSDLKPVRYFGGNPVYDIHGMEVTIWDFSASRVQCLNLFSDGTITQEYQLTRK